MSVRLKKLQDRKAAAKSRMDALLKLAAEENRDLSAEESTEFDGLNNEILEPKTGINASIAREERLQQLEREMATVPDVNEDTETEANDRIEPGAAKPVWRNFGEQLAAIAEAGRPGGKVDQRLTPSAGPTGGSANVGSDGGYLIQKDFAQDIFKKAYELSALAQRCQRVGIGDTSDGLEYPYVDETSRATGSRWGGVRVYRRAEADTVTASKPKIGKGKIDLEDLMGIAYMTNRLMRDAPAMTAIYNQAFAEEFSFVIDDEIFRGTGSGQCLGILTAPATVSVAKETGQAGGSVVTENIDKMWSRCWGRSRLNAAWFINQDVEPALESLSKIVGAAGVPAYMPPGGIADAPYGRLKGRPVIPIEQCSTLGTVGDIVLADLSQYFLIEKDGMRFDESMHVRFLYDEMAFRFVMRINGMPKWHSALTPYKGSNTLSPFVTLATRS